MRFTGSAVEDLDYDICIHLVYYYWRNLGTNEERINSNQMVLI